MLADAVQILLKYYPFFLSGVKNTIILAFTGTIAGTLIGLLTGIIRTTPLSDYKIIRIIQHLLNAIIAVYVEVFRGTPMMVQAMVLYWGYAGFTHSSPDLMISGMIIITINTGAYMTEVVRGGIISIDKGQFEGAYSIGMTHVQTMVKIVFPQVMRNILPGTANELINNIKDSSVLNVIGVTELFFFATKIKIENYKIFETYLVTCFIYLCITFTATRLLRLWERKLQGKENFQLVESPEEKEVNHG